MRLDCFSGVYLGSFRFSLHWLLQCSLPIVLPYFNWYNLIYFGGFCHRASTSTVSRGSLRLWVFTCTRIWDIQPLFTIFLSTTACTASAVVLHGGSYNIVDEELQVCSTKTSIQWIEQERSIHWVLCKMPSHWVSIECMPSWCFVGLLQHSAYIFVRCQPGHFSRLPIFELHLLAFHNPSSQSCGVPAWRHEQCIFIESHYQLPAIRRVESMFLASIMNLFVRLLSRLSVLLDSPWRMCPSQLLVQMMFLLRSQRALDGIILSQGQDFQHFPAMRPRPYWIK